MWNGVISLRGGASENCTSNLSRHCRPPNRSLRRCALGWKPRPGTASSASVETLTKKGKLVAYEAKVLTMGKTSEVRSARTGKLWTTRNNARWKLIPHI